MAATSVSEKLFKALKKIDRPGTFCVQGSVPAVLPGLKIDGVGPIGFPLTVAQAKEIKGRCQQAPYGKGELTLVDTKVRRVWQMTPDQFKLTNPDWRGFLEKTVKSVQQAPMPEAMLTAGRTRCRQCFPRVASPESRRRGVSCRRG